MDPSTGFTSLEKAELERLFAAARREDGADVTSQALLSPGAQSVGHIVPRSACCVAGLPALAIMCEAFQIAFTELAPEGADVQPGRPVAELCGPSQTLLGAERILLNFLGRLSGVASLTRLYARRCHPTPVYDTRKTTPGWRCLEKYAVRVGGGRNHRMGLSDQVLIKDNHLALLRRGGAPHSIAEIVARARRAAPALKVEIEVETLADFMAAVRAGAHIVMLDNWSADTTREAIAWLREGGPHQVEIELSGGITLERCEALADLGADRISVGALTHSAPACDFSLEM